jgi:hypothetical protein
MTESMNRPILRLAALFATRFFRLAHRRHVAASVKRERALNNSRHRAIFQTRYEFELLIYVGLYDNREPVPSLRHA